MNPVEQLQLLEELILRLLLEAGVMVEVSTLSLTPEGLINFRADILPDAVEITPTEESIDQKFLDIIGDL